MITNEKGGIIDDTVVTKFSDSVGMVINGACKHKDLEHLTKMLEKSSFNASIEHLDNLSLFALQGPKAASALTRICEGFDMREMLFMAFEKAKINGIECTVTRCGYTGEDGFELSVSNDQAPALMESLLDLDEVKPAGLGARDTLRIEAGLCLYGNDIDEDTTPVEAGLLWTIGKRRRKEANFPGANVILQQIKDKPQKKRVGLVVDGPPARAHVELYDESKEKKIGEITSGTFSPTMEKPIAIGYVAREFSKVDSVVYAKVRKNFAPAKITKMPMVPARYYRGPEQ